RTFMTPKCWSEWERPPGFRRTGRFFPLQKRTLLKTLKMCLSHRDLGSLLGLERFLLVATFSLLDSRACRLCRIRELAMAAAISLRNQIPALGFRSGSPFSQGQTMILPEGWNPPGEAVFDDGC
ncbi:hypothetical protein GOODEAATRI_026783, partial [Goodea atripinnis]